MKRLIAVALFVLFVGGWEGAAACSCFGAATPCAAYAEASAVVIGSVEGVRPDAPGPERYEGEQTVSVRVGHAFKGEAGGEITLLQPGDNCTPKFKPGDRWLMYLSFHEESRMWTVHGCGRSGPAEDAGDDLRFLRALPESAGRTRISGTFVRYEKSPEQASPRGVPTAGAKVLIKGEGKTYEVASGADGVYEIYDLPPGRYSLTPEPPPGLKLRFPMRFGPLALADDHSILSELKPDACAGSDFLLGSDTLVGGKVLDADGEAMPHVCLKLMPADEVANPHFRMSRCTDDGGRYALNSIPPGRYLIVANDDGRLSGNEPFPTAYYPGVFDRGRATVVTVGEGEKHESFDIRIPAVLPTRRIGGVVRYSDGRPAAGARVHFRVDAAKPPYEAWAAAKTDAQGRFSLKTLRDAAGSIAGLMYTPGELAEQCPELKKLIAESWKFWGEVRTKPARVAAGQDRHNVVLTFPFPHCPEKESP